MIENIPNVPDGWQHNSELSYSDVSDFIDSACTVLSTIESIDFSLLEDGRETKKNITSACIQVIGKGLNCILAID